MTAPVIPAGTTQAVQPQAGTYNFTTNWYTFFQSLLAYVQTGPIGPVPLVGVTDGSNAAAGNVGEYLSSFVPSGSAVNLVNDTATQITSLLLTPGDWDLYGEVFFQATSATMDTTIGVIATTVTITPTVPSDGADLQRRTDSSTTLLTINGLRTRVSITNSTTYILTGFVDFSGTSVAGYGALRARRVR